MSLELSPDVINAMFELSGAVFVLASIVRLYAEKAVAGVNWITPSFFFFWGVWNLYYYPALGQWLSFYAGICLAIANAIWIAQLLWYGSQRYAHLPDPR